MLRHVMICLAAVCLPAQTAGAHDLYLLMGQSNMSGRGALVELKESERQPNTGILLYANDGQWRVASEPIDDAANQLDPVSADANAGVGPALFFARALRVATSNEIGLVPCAKGSTSVLDWLPAQARDRLYGSCLFRAKQAARRGRIAGILWYQGETDAARKDVAASWARHAHEVLTRFRAHLNDPRIPVVIVSLADPPETGPYAGRYPSWATVRAQQQAIGLSHTAIIRAAGLARTVDRFHLSTAGQRILGQTLATAMLRLTAKQGLSK